MYTTLHCVALRTVRHSDRMSILTAWSAERGRVALSMPAGSGAESRRRRALTGALALFECEADVRPGREVFNVRDLRALRVTHGIAMSPMRAGVAMFLAEALSLILRDGGPDTRVWQLVSELVVELNEATNTALANFHLHFLTMLAACLGIAPDASQWRPGRVLDIEQGSFIDAPAGAYIYIMCRACRACLMSDSHVWLTGY